MPHRNSVRRQVESRLRRGHCGVASASDRRRIGGPGPPSGGPVPGRLILLGMATQDSGSADRPAAATPDLNDLLAAADALAPRVCKWPACDKPPRRLSEREAFAGPGDCEGRGGRRPQYCSNAHQRQTTDAVRRLRALPWTAAAAVPNSPGSTSQRPQSKSTTSSTRSRPCKPWPGRCRPPTPRHAGSRPRSWTWPSCTAAGRPRTQSRAQQA